MARWRIKAPKDFDVAVQVQEMHHPESEEDFVHHWFEDGWSYFQGDGILVDGQGRLKFDKIDQTTDPIQWRYYYDWLEVTPGMLEKIESDLELILVTH